MARGNVNVKVKKRSQYKIHHKADKKIQLWNSSLWIRDNTKGKFSKTE